MFDLTEKESELFKQWIMVKLGDSSDAQPDILADYVIALIKAEETEAQARAACLEQLEDFLQDKTGAFVDEVLKAGKTKEFVPGYKPEAPSLQLNASAPAFNPPTGPASAPLPGTNGAGNKSRKRGFDQSDANDGPTGRVPTGPSAERNFKQPRRGRGNFAGGNLHNNNNTGRGPQQQQGQQQNNPFAAMSGMNQQGSQSSPTFPGMPQMPTPPPGFPSDPMAALMAMQQLFGQMSNMPQFGAQGPRKTGKRCRDYDNKGYCSRGANCQYDHVNQDNKEQYDPNGTGMALDSPKDGSFDGGRGRGNRGGMRGNRGADRGGRGGRMGRSNWSVLGARQDKNNTTIVVEQIPEDKFNEASIREFFNEFGTLENIDMKDEFGRKVALLKFADWEAANRAYSSPKVVFDNRFVKVYWFKTEDEEKSRQQHNGYGGGGAPSSNYAMEVEEPQIDPAEFAKKQEEAQKRHEENQKKQAEAQAKQEELRKQIAAQAEERKKLLEMLQAKTGGGAAASTTDATTNGTATAANPQTEALRDKLAELEAEAKTMGIDTQADGDTYTGLNTRGRGRGTFRGGRGGYVPRGGAGGYRGGAGAGGYNAGRGGVMRLDNRPKSLAITAPNGEEWDRAKDEALRSYLLTSNLDFDHIEFSSPPAKTTLIVRFKARYMGEQFLNQGTDIPSVGKVEATWVPNPTIPAGSAGTGGNDAQISHQADTAMDTGANPAQGQAMATDLDVGEGAEHWNI